jgi:quercetin dioxygenase-like cupin family protein
VLRPQGNGVDVTVMPAPSWYAVEEWNGVNVTGTHNAQIHEWAHGRILLVRIAAGGRFPMHAGSVYTICQIVTGRGSVGLPDGEILAYRAPEVLIFEPGTPHAWIALENTEFSVCEIAPER